MRSFLAELLASEICTEPEGLNSRGSERRIQGKISYSCHAREHTKTHLQHLKGVNNARRPVRDIQKGLKTPVKSIELLDRQSQNLKGRVSEISYKVQDFSSGECSSAMLHSSTPGGNKISFAYRFSARMKIIIKRLDVWVFVTVKRRCLRSFALLCAESGKYVSRLSSNSLAGCNEILMLFVEVDLKH